MPKAIEDKMKKQASKLAAAGKLKKTQSKGGKEAKSADVSSTLANLKKKYNLA